MIECEYQQNAELFIVEGKSAANAVSVVRRRTDQAILPLQGKMINSRKCTVKKLCKDPIVQVMTQSIRSDGLSKFEEGTLRFEKLIILTDGDVDGVHARSLIMLFFYLHMPWILESKKLYSVYPPLYQIHSVEMSDTLYAFSRMHRESLLKNLSLEGIGCIESVHYKGVASLHSDVLASQCINPKTRAIRQISMADCARI
ncbi:hypothetical protein AB833_22030 [Chromatiales bacterium (ex Bugula neritina AB1)]|nr:hypothetical protein AB833_22030 [Chromatiales bacterium (ex Bugula neritina AB1)]